MLVKKTTTKKYRYNLYHIFCLGISACENGFEPVGENCYLVVESHMTMSQAEDHCDGLGAILAEPRTAEDQTRVGDLCKQKHDICFLGLVGDGSGGFVWRSDDTQPTNNVWARNQPNTQSGQCVFYTQRKWQVDHCHSNHRFICQKCKY